MTREPDAKRIALGFRPRGCRRVRVLGVKADLARYDPEARELIASADRVLYPTRLYAQVLSDAGKRVFPSPRHYAYHADKIRQTLLFQLLGIPTPRTGVFFGRHAGEALVHFRYPFVAKKPRGSGQGRGVFLIRDENDWREYLSLGRIAYVQEYLPLERDLRVAAVAGRLLAAYWRVIPPGGFRANLYQGGTIDLKDVPAEGVDFALDVIRKCGFDDVGLDVCRHRGRWLVLEANMHYGLEGVNRTGASLPDFLDRLIGEGVI